MPVLCRKIAHPRQLSTRSTPASRPTRVPSPSAVPCAPRAGETCIPLCPPTVSCVAAPIFDASAQGIGDLDAARTLPCPWRSQPQRVTSALRFPSGQGRSGPRKQANATGSMLQHTARGVYGSSDFVVATGARTKRHRGDAPSSRVSCKRTWRWNRPLPHFSSCPFDLNYAAPTLARTGQTCLRLD